MDQLFAAESSEQGQRALTSTIGYAGLSHLGVVSSAATASKGYQVTAYDPDPSLVDDLASGRPPIAEPQLPELLARHGENIRYTSEASELSECSLIFLSEDVPTGADDQSDLSPLQSLVDEVVPHIPQSGILVVLSQVPPGFSRALSDTLRRLGGGREQRVFYQVETLVVGDAVERALNPERFIVGCAYPEVPLPERYASLLSSYDCPVLPMRFESAELAKISINMCLVSSISTANTLAELCEAIGADWSEIVPALKSDRRIGPHAYLSPGLGISGGNLERDLAAVRTLAAESGTDAGVVDAWLSDSNHRRDWAIRKVHVEVVSPALHPVIAVWGLAYKANTAVTKNSPSLALIDALRSYMVKVYDPEAVLDDRTVPNAVQGESALDVCRGADALVVMTTWSEFSSADLDQVREAMRGSVIIDPLSTLDRRRCAELGFTHIRLGAPAESPRYAA